jgi:predicted peptidase
MPVWVFHGAKDPAVPVEESERIVEALKKTGNTEVKFTVYPEAQHDSWTVTYDNPELYRWLLEHKRPAPDTVKTQAR